MQVYPQIVAPLLLVDLAAVLVVVIAGAIVDLEVWGDEADARGPVIDPGGPAGVGGVAGVEGEAGGEVEEAAVGDGVFVIVAGEGRIVLPFQAAGASYRVLDPAGGVVFEDGYGEGEVGCGTIWGGVRGVGAWEGGER